MWGKIESHWACLIIMFIGNKKNIEKPEIYSNISLDLIREIPMVTKKNTLLEVFIICDFGRKKALNSNTAEFEPTTNNNIYIIIFGEWDDQL